MSLNQAALTMTLEEYRAFWYRQGNITPPAPDERLSVRQVTDERLIREGYEYRRKSQEDQS